MKNLLALIIIFSGIVVASGDVGRSIPQIDDVATPDDLRREFRRLSESIVPRTGGDLIIYRDVKNARVGIGTVTPKATLDVASGGFGFPPAAAIRGTITPSRAGVAYYNSTTNNGEVCISTGTGINQWAKMNSPGSACSN